MTEHTQPKQKTDNGLAIASLVLGILSVTGFGILTGIPAIITGAIGMKNPHNKGMSIAGLVMGSISMLLTIFLILLFVVVFIIAAAGSGHGQINPDSYDQIAPRLEQRT